MPHAVIIRNPTARRAIPAERLRAAARAQAPSWTVEVRDTGTAADSATHAAEAALGGADVVLACGGDGTLNGVLNGVRDAATHGGPDVTVGLVPAGTANVWARETRIPRGADGALRLLEEGRIVRADLGLATVAGVEQRFLLVCGMGLDAAVVAAVERSPRMKRRLAQGAFAVAGARALWTQPSVIAVVEADGVSLRRSIVLGIAGNTRLYGGVSPVTSAAELDDGLLDLALFEGRSGGRGLYDRTRHVMGAARRLRSGWHGVVATRFSYTRAAEIVVRPERLLPVQLDGEPFHSCGPDAPLTLRVERRAVRLLVPDRPNPLFHEFEPAIGA